jgi:hypothetical protein
MPTLFRPLFVVLVVSAALLVGCAAPQDRAPSDKDHAAHHPEAGASPALKGAPGTPAAGGSEKR